MSDRGKDPVDPQTGDTLRRESSESAESMTPATVRMARRSSGAEPLRTGDVVDRYVVLHRVGQGGMGVVYAAYDPQLDRKVAIKILHPDVASHAPRQRLLREAQAMARVSHPNVMRVYDVGTVGELVFIAMELVEGSTLSEHLHTHHPDWRECLRLFVGAGRGLAAAHAAGLVHRDFKPGNVLVGPGTAVRVIDFGVARADKGSSSGPELPEQIRESSGPVALDAQLTRAGALVGTPHYMSPEQLMGQPADARSDQFSFCVAAWQALYGERPFAAETIQELGAAITRGQLREPPRGSPVPNRVRRALMRGLAASPGERWPSMDELLAELGRDAGARVRQRLGLALALGVVGVLALTWLGLRRQASQSCVRDGAQISRLWNEEKKAELRAAFAATGAPFAEDAWSTMSKRLDAYTAGWSAMRTEACLSARVDATQNDEQLTLRAACLEERAQEVGALLEVFSKPDPKVVQGAVSAAHALTPLARCADLVALRSLTPPPAAGAERTNLEAARVELAAAKGLLDSGKVSEALARATKADELARASGYGPAIAEALVRKGELQGKTGDRKTAEATLQEAVSIAETAGADELAARAWTKLAFVVGYELGRHAEGEAFARYAEAAIARQGGNPELTAENLRSLGLVLENEGRYEEALKVLKESLATRERLYGAEHPAAATGATSVGNAYIMMHRYAEARQYHERALRIQLALLGQSHPDASTSYHNLAICLSHLGERAQGIAYLEKALSIDSAVYGPHSDHTALTRETLAKAWFETHQSDQAREAALEALADLTAALGEGAPMTCPALLLLGRIAFEQGQPKEALKYVEKGLAIREKQMGADHQILGDYLLVIGNSQLALHQPKVAFVTFGRALRLKGADQWPPDERAEKIFGLARATWDSGGDKAAATVAAVDAKQLFEQVPGHADEARAIDAWLDTHRAPKR